MLERKLSGGPVKLLLGFLGQVDVSLFVVNFLRFFVAHEQDGGAE